MDATSMMAEREVNHLVVVAPGSRMVVGTLSSLDLVLRTSASAPLLRSPSKSQVVSPTVGELLQQHGHFTPQCKEGASLRDAADLLLRSDRTAAVVAVHGTDEQRTHLGMLTENDIMQAYIDGWRPETDAQEWVQTHEAPQLTIPQYLLVRPSTRLTEAASLMLMGASAGHVPTRGPLHHLAVMGNSGIQGSWLGIFSTLDIARGLANLHSELDIAQVGVDETTVDMVMKPVTDVPSVKPSDTIQHAFTELLNTSRHAAFVFDEHGAFYGVVTPRCAMEAFAKGVPPSTTVISWLQHHKNDEGPRHIEPQDTLHDAARVMMAYNIHHLVVRNSEDETFSAPVGVVSSLDLARGLTSIYSHRPFESLGWLYNCGGPHSCSVAK
eukprot:gb/GFBE01023586.1/.p1 GENE.gb/GFBE01023586.1/~~gb/GFBE01023586.1/.p1  ORF type:complete len:382 (+),score=60.68 gb/GFBE01023586.1/:1-1146(+)